jgi:hypothetical protein
MTLEHAPTIGTIYNHHYYHYNRHLRSNVFIVQATIKANLHLNKHDELVHVDSLFLS